LSSAVITETEEAIMAKTTAPKKTAARDVLSLKVTLRDIRPPIWRRIVMPGTMNLFDLHMAIQVTMGWMDSHLHSFDVGGQQYGDPAMTDDVKNEDRLSLNGVVGSGISRFRYTYDFGDNWDHDILIEKAPPASNATVYPACVAGKRHCPPEDCGGAWGYAELLGILADPANPQFEEQKEWIGEDFDPEAFSVSEADTILATAFRRKK
jgi:hypothetical protein